LGIGDEKMTEYKKKIAHLNKIKWCVRCGARTRENRPNVKTVRDEKGRIKYREHLLCPKPSLGDNLMIRGRKGTVVKLYKNSYEFDIELEEIKEKVPTTGKMRVKIPAQIIKRNMRDFGNQMKYIKGQYNTTPKVIAND
jgi:hypothetical protein